VVRVKTRKKSSLGRVERRRKERIKKGYGSTPYQQPQKSKRHNVKTTKKLDLRYECGACKKQHPSKQGMRVKKLELT
jgi:ribosomal protein L44E